MDWFSWPAGAAGGALVSLSLEHGIIRPTLHRLHGYRRRRRHAATNRRWRAVEASYSTLHLVQAGWSDGVFPPNSVSFTLTDDFKLTDRRLIGFRDQHTAEWQAKKHTDDEQVGIASFGGALRISDNFDDEAHGRSHKLELNMHSYRYFDHLATHGLWLTGSESERSALATIIGEPEFDRTIDGFPNPCSVGLSLFCEDGDWLALTRRATATATGGHYQGGKVFNAVGENAIRADFSSYLGGPLTSNPYVVARRGLHQEAGFSGEQIEASTIGIHSFAWSSAVLDHKFFGWATTSLPREEVQEQWRNAPDRNESKGPTMEFEPVRTTGDCVKLLTRIRDEHGQWAPEAVFSTIRSLLIYKKAVVTMSEVVDVFE